MLFNIQKNNNHKKIQNLSMIKKNILFHMNNWSNEINNLKLKK